jgi:hypothetical protein
MKPITWRVTPSTDGVRMDSRFADVDVFAAIKRGIESWNGVFGFPVFTVERAGPEASWADDEKNVFIWDSDPNGGAAFANLRLNPNTGEIRGASVYLPSSFLEEAHRSLVPGAAAPPRAPAPAGRRPRFVWLPLHAPALCETPAAEPSGSEIPTGTAAQDIAGLSLKEKLERRITGTAAHEIGHALGLRHNFKGSLTPPSSSIMDYLDLAHRIAAPLPGAYDRQAIEYLYGSSGALPTLPFCSDQDTARDPLCARYDATATPLESHHGVRYRTSAERFLATAAADAGFVSNFEILLDSLAALERFVRQGPSASRLVAWRRLLEPLKDARPTSSARVASHNAHATRVLRALFPDPPAPGQTAAPAAQTTIAFDGALAVEAAADLQATVLNTEGWRVMSLRRQAVDALRRMQHLEGLKALRDAREKLLAARATAEPDGRPLLDDLIARIERAVSPYFDR